MAIDAYFATDFNLTLPERVQAYLKSVDGRSNCSGFETGPLQQVTFLSHSQTSKQVRYRVTIPHSLCNKDGNLHGGAATTILDNLSSTALFTVARPGFWENMGVSRSLHVTFLKSVPAGSLVEVTCSVIAAGRQMASLRAEMRNGVDGKLCVLCAHDKVGLMNAKM